MKKESSLLLREDLHYKQESFKMLGFAVKNQSSK